MKVKVKQLKYVAAPPISPEFTAEFNKIVPVCPGDSTQRILRFVWGCDRLELRRNIVGTTPRRRYVDWDGKYLGRPRWVLEGWVKPEVYNQEDWTANQHVLGDFPNNGVWDFIQYHEDEDGEFLPLDHTAILVAKANLFWNGNLPEKSVKKYLQQIELRDEMEMEARRQAAAKVAEEFGEEWVKAEEQLYKNPVSTIPNNFRKTESGLIIPN